jgi:hypothetical protein
VKGYLAAVAISLLVMGCTLPGQMGKFGSAHEHADFKVYINGVHYNFSQAKYMTPDIGGGEQNCGANDTALAHLHDMDGDVVHKHATGVTWAYFFSTLNITMSENCIVFDDGSSYCNYGSAKWRYVLNGKEYWSIAGLEIHDLDRALFTYNATDEQVKGQFDNVTYKAATEDSGGSCGEAPANATNAS